MTTERFESNMAIYLSLIKALANVGMLQIAQLYVQHIPDIFLTNDRIQKSLIHMWVCFPRLFLISLFQRDKFRVRLALSMRQNEFLKHCLNQIILNIQQ